MRSSPRFRWSRPWCRHGCWRAAADEWLGDVIEGNRLATLALHPQPERSTQLVPGGAIADGVIGLADDGWCWSARDEAPRAVANHGSTPLALWDLDDAGADRRVLASGPEAGRLFERAVAEWKLLMAAALVGLADAALRRAVEFATNRVAFGVPIATFQAVSHPLVDVAMAVTGTRRLVWKAAWFADNEPGEAHDLIPMAYLTRGSRPGRRRRRWGSTCRAGWVHAWSPTCTCSSAVPRAGPSSPAIPRTSSTPSPPPATARPHRTA